MTVRHIQTVCQRLVLEIGYASDIGVLGLTAAIREALEKGGVLGEAEVVYMRAEAPEERYCAIDLWAPEAEPYRHRTDVEREIEEGVQEAQAWVKGHSRESTDEELAQEEEAWRALDKDMREDTSTTCIPCQRGLHEGCDNICKEGYWMCECCYTQAKRQAEERDPNL